MPKQAPATPSASVFRFLASGLTCLALAWSGWAQGEIYKFVDDNGHVTYTNMPRPGAKKIELGKSGGKPATAEANTDKKRSAASNPTPGGFPRVDPGTQRKRDDMRRQLLVEELSSEQRNLNAAQSAYLSGRRQPGADLDRLTEAVRLHEKNIEMLNKELAHIR
jgi:hypothetical protein